MIAPLRPRSFTALSSSEAASSGDCMERTARAVKLSRCFSTISPSSSLAILASLFPLSLGLSLDSRRCERQHFDVDAKVIHCLKPLLQVDVGADYYHVISFVRDHQSSLIVL